MLKILALLMTALTSLSFVVTAALCLFRPTLTLMMLMLAQIAICWANLRIYQRPT